MEFAVLRAIFVINAVLQQGGMGEGASLRSKKGICPPAYGCECSEIQNYCTVGDDSTCADDLKCCFNGCEFDCLVPDPAPAPPPKKGDKGTGGGVASSRSKAGICPPHEDVECPDDIENFCTQGDDNTCADDLKCCYTGCEYDCIVPDPVPDQPARKGDKGTGGGVASSRSKPGKCPPYEPAECREDSEDYCTRGDDSTCVDDLKCCFTGCEYDCMVAVPAPAQPPGKGSAGNEGEKAENGLVGPPGPPGPPGSTSAAPTGGPGSK